MEKFQKASDSESYAPSSEPFVALKLLLGTVCTFITQRQVSKSNFKETLGLPQTVDLQGSCYVATFMVKMNDEEALDSSKGL
jgi:hypothetical protein